METSLQLLMRDGAAIVQFYPRLTAEEYAELLECVALASTKEQLQTYTAQMAAKWGKQFDFDSAIDRS